MNVRLKQSLIGAGVVVCGYVVLMLLTPQFGRVVGYADHQPPQVINSTSPNEAHRILDLTKLHLQYRPEIARDYWPEPSSVEEHAGCWLVTFVRKVPTYRFLGYEETVAPTDKVMFMAVEKNTGTVRFGKWCQ